MRFSSSAGIGLYPRKNRIAKHHRDRVPYEFRDMVKALHRAGTARAWDIESESFTCGHEIDRRSVDPTGLYQVGSFVGDSWREWNGRFRADARDFSVAPRVQ